MTGLKPVASQRARSLGTPGRKRLEIARVLATGPRLMLLDEALAGLTPAELQEAIALVRRIHELGVTLVIVEHIMEVIMTLAQRVLVFNQGRVIAQGKPHEVVRDEAVIEAYLGRGHRPAQCRFVATLSCAGATGLIGARVSSAQRGTAGNKYHPACEERGHLHRPAICCRRVATHRGIQRRSVHSTDGVRHDRRARPWRGGFVFALRRKSHTRNRSCADPSRC